jgi:hypothetical protein
MSRAKSSSRVPTILAELHRCQNLDDEEAFGTGKLCSFLHSASQQEFDEVLREAKRDNGVRRALSAARYYSGLSSDKCTKIDALVSTPFRAAARKKR